MKFSINIGLPWMLQKIRLVFLVGIFYVIYTYSQPVYAFMWALYFILNDLSEVISDIDLLKEEKEDQSQMLRSMLTKRKGF